MNREKILVTAIGGRAAYNFVRCLKESELGERLYIIGADMSPNSPKVCCDNFVTILPPGDANYVSSLQKVVEDLGVGLVVPTSDEECLALARNREHLGNINTIPIGSYESVLSAKDKLRLYEETKKLEVVPKTVEIKKGARIGEIMKKINPPAFIKPRMGRGGRYTHLIKSGTLGEEDNLADYWKSYKDDFGPPVCQPFIESSDYGIETYTNNRGEIHFGAARKKLKVNTGDKIVGMHAVSVDEPGMEEVSREIIEALGLRGMVEIEMRKSPSGKFYALDVNPRVGGSIYISKASGRNIAMLPVLDYLDEPYPEFDYRTGVEIMREEVEEDGRKFFWDSVLDDIAGGEAPSPSMEPILAEAN